MPAGTIVLTNNSATVTGTGTSFTSELKVNDFLVSTVGGLAYTLGVKSIESNTSLTLIEKYTGPSATGQSWSPVPYGTMAAITAQLASQVTYAIRGLNLDKANWQQIFTGTGTITVNLPDGSRFQGPAWEGVAKKGDNDDITSLKALGEGVVLREVNQQEGLGGGVIFECNNPLEASFGISNVGGGTAVFHNYAKPLNGNGSVAGSLIGGYGSRPWQGDKYTDHSTAALHFLMDGQCTSSNHGGWMRFMLTPFGKTMEQRIQSVAFSNNGDTWIGRNVPTGAYKMESLGATLAEPLSWNGRGLKQISYGQNEINLITPRNGASASMVIRGTSLDGNFESGGFKGATVSQDALWLGLGGHDSNDFVGLKAGVRIAASENWTSTTTSAGITFATTSIGSTTRQDRWLINNAGNLLPAADNTYSIGLAGYRASAVYAVNGTIQTSDATLKTDVRKFTTDEINAAKLLSKEIGFFSWIEKQQQEGSAAREHTGMTVQRAIEIMKSCNLDPMHYGFICYDSWESTKVVSGYSDETTPIMKTIPAGERYSFRYDQLNLFIARGFEERLSKIEG